MPFALAGTADMTDSMQAPMSMRSGISETNEFRTRGGAHTHQSSLKNVVSHVLRLLLNLHECGDTLQMRSFDVLQPVGCAVTIPPPKPLAKIVTLHVYMCVCCC